MSYTASPVKRRGETKAGVEGRRTRCSSCPGTLTFADPSHRFGKDAQLNMNFGRCRGRRPKRQKRLA